MLGWAEQWLWQELSLPPECLGRFCGAAGLVHPLCLGPELGSVPSMLPLSFSHEDTDSDLWLLSWNGV